MMSKMGCRNHISHEHLLSKNATIFDLRCCNYYCILVNCFLINRNIVRLLLLRCLYVKHSCLMTVKYGVPSYVRLTILYCNSVPKKKKKPIQIKLIYVYYGSFVTHAAKSCIVLFYREFPTRSRRKVIKSIPVLLVLDFGPSESSKL